MSKSDVENTPRKVFISYSHKDEVWKDRLLPQLNALVQAGVCMEVWHDRQIDAGEKWYPAIEKAMADAAVAVLFISADYLASSFCIKEEVPYLLKRQEEAGMLLIPVLIRQSPWKAHRWLADRQMLPRDGKCVAIDFPGDQADAVFSEVAERVFAHFQQFESPIQPSSTRKAVERVDIARGPRPLLAPDRIDLTRLPETGAALFGRDEELKFLDQAWSSGEKTGSGKTRVLAFVAYGGVGKSTLVNHWLHEMRGDDFRGATRVFGWSFYSQGAREEGMASADTFIDAALRFFGDPDPASGSPWDKGGRLARLAGAERTLLVLDGMEPLQSGQTFDKGKLRDPALESLLRGLARRSKGLCLITTREPLPDLAGREGVAVYDLEQISPEAGRALLRAARVVGTDAELEAVAGRFGPHALAVSLLGVYLHEKDPHHGIGPAKVLEQMPGKEPIDRVLAGFEQWLADTAELEVLRMLGLFDRPADAGCLGALRAKPAILSLADRVVESSDADWDRILGRLERLRLIHVRHKDTTRPVVDAHPLLREHFAQQLRDKNPKVWRAAHRRLYEHLTTSVEEYQPNTLEGLQPLYQAVAHGCQARLCRKALWEVFVPRVRRNHQHFSFYCLGAVGSDLSAFFSFLRTEQLDLDEKLDDRGRAYVLNEAGSSLRAAGRLGESVDLIMESLRVSEKLKNWEGCASSARNLAGAFVAVGKLDEAVEAARKAVRFAEKSQRLFDRYANHCWLGRALHLMGKRDDALKVFREAQKRAKKSQPELVGLQAAFFCDLLLESHERQMALELASYATHPENRTPYLRDNALCHLALAENSLWPYQQRGSDFILPGLNDALRSIAQELNEALDGLRSAVRQDEIPLVLLTRAWQRSLTGVRTGPESAQSDLDEAWEIAERGPMRLHMADIHLHRARLFHAVTPYPWDKDPQGKPRGPKDDLAAARTLIEQCGYWRRKEELEDAEEAAKSW